MKSHPVLQSLVIVTCLGLGGCGRAQFFGFNDRIRGSGSGSPAPDPSSTAGTLGLTCTVPSGPLTVKSDGRALSLTVHGEVCSTRAAGRVILLVDTSLAAAEVPPPAQVPPGQASPGQLPLLAAASEENPCPAASSAAAWLARAAARFPAQRVSLLAFGSNDRSPGPQVDIAAADAVASLAAPTACSDAAGQTAGTLAAALSLLNVWAAEDPTPTTVVVFADRGVSTPSTALWQEALTVSVVIAARPHVTLVASTTGASEAAVARLSELVGASGRVEAEPTLAPAEDLTPGEPGVARFFDGETLFAEEAGVKPSPSPDDPTRWTYALAPVVVAPDRHGRSLRVVLQFPTQAPAPLQIEQSFTVEP